MRLTEKFLDKLKPTDKRQNIRDDDPTGFGIRVEPQGRKSFFFNAKVCGSVVYKALGEYPAVTLKDARDRAKELSGLAAKWKQNGCKGDNPFRAAKKAAAASEAPTFETLVESYITNYVHSAKANLNHPDRAEAMLRWAIKKYFGDWLQRPVDSFAVQDVIALRDSAGERRYMANRLIQYCRALFDWCSNDGDGRTPVWQLAVNPARKVSLFEETARERVLSPEEFVQLEDALASEPYEDLRDFILLALDTAARKMNILEMQWSEIDWDLNQWKIPMSKSGKPYTVDLLPRAVETLRRRLETRTTHPYVFPPISGRYLHVDKPFVKFCKRAGLADFHIHDLRRSSAAAMARAGVAPQKIAHALGQTSMSSILIYARMAQKELPEARELGAQKVREEIESARARMKARYDSRVQPIRETA